MISDSTATFDSSTCGQCGTPIFPGLGFCPMCRLEDGLSESDDSDSGNVGDYKIMHVLGKGGFGRVYFARQVTPVKRYVALKILQQHRQDEVCVSRFLIEQQAMARMNHPNIAKIYDAGESERGPYLAMELIEGKPITDYCDSNSLTIHERLRLFEDVCKGVHHAHQNAIIHRDIKPSNILVMETDGVPVAKIIDFGVAKAIGNSLTDFTLEMSPGQVIGTPEYMSPEQALGSQDIDTRVDIYALGVLLYELLVGSPPFSRHQLQEASIKAILDTIAHTQPPTPSECLNEMSPEDAEIVAETGKTTPGAMRRTIRGDLDWIVMKAIEKDRKWRHDTAKGLLADVRSYLGKLPLPSRKSTITYRCHKFVQRHRPKVMAAAAFLILLGCMGTVRWYQKWADQAEDARQFVDEILNFDSTALLGHFVIPRLSSNSERSNRIVNERLRETIDDQEKTPASRARAALVLLDENLVVKDKDRDFFVEKVFNWLLTLDSYDLASLLPYVQSLPGMPAYGYKVLQEDLGRLDKDDRLCAVAVAAGLKSSEPWNEYVPSLEAWNISFGDWLPLLRPVAQYLSDEDLIQWIGESEGRGFIILSEIFNKRYLSPSFEKKVVDSLKQPLSPDVGYMQEGRLFLALLHSDEPPDCVWEELGEQEDPTVRSFIIHNAHKYNVPYQHLVDRLEVSKNPFVITSLLNALLDYKLSSGDRVSIISILKKLYLYSSDDGVCSNAKFALENFNAPVPEKNVSAEQKGANGHEMVRVKLSNRTIAVSKYETTVDQYERYRARRTDPESGMLSVPTHESQNLPQTQVSGYFWMDYCNWLSIQDGLDLCYTKGGGDILLRPVEGFTSKAGYRMPTSEEWLSVSQAGSMGRFPFGNDSDIANYYACYNSDHPLPVGTLRPNAFGLFDNVGNFAEICHVDSNRSIEYAMNAFGCNHTPPILNRADGPTGSKTGFDGALPGRHFTVRVVRTMLSKP